MITYHSVSDSLRCLTHIRLHGKNSDHSTSRPEHSDSEHISAFQASAMRFLVFQCAFPVKKIVFSALLISSSNIFCSVLTQIFSWGSKLWWSTNNNPDKNWSKKIELYMQDNGWGITWGFCHWSRGVSVVRCVATCLQIKFGFWHFSSSFIIRQSWTNLSNLSQYLVRIF